MMSDPANPSLPSPRRVRAGQVELSVLDVGRGMPVVLVHGFPLDYTMWEAQIAFLGSRLRVIAPDLRGFGASDVTPGTASMSQMADDLAALLDALDIDEPVVICGLSMGGYVALEFWRRHAARLRALVFCDTRAAADAPAAAEARLETAQRILSEGTGPLAEGMLPKLFAAETLEHSADVTGAARQVVLNTPPEGAAAALRGMRERSDFTDALSEIAVPTLVIVGEQDVISPVDEMRDMAAGIPNAEFVILPSAGHMSPMENPAGFNEAIEQFLTRVERS
ncbi:MAG: alpha/beta fold hydrolase [Planctomycetota bacterium]|nr:MAG: alpha/beta fold hydrolase [Planctomycetota bacterium]